MKYSVFGKTGLKVSELGFGGIPILRLETSEAVRILRHAFDRGITFYDTANAYKDSEEKMGIAFEGIRDKVVIATKTLKRDAAGATEHLENSLRMLRTDYIDLYQLHQVAQAKDWETIIAPGGAMEVAVKAQQEGKIRHIGVTSHSLSMAIKLIKTGLFSSIQFPFNFIETEATELHAVARDLNLGILAMKPFAGGVIDNAELAFKYLRQYPDVLAIPGYDSVDAVDGIIAIYERQNVVEEADRQKMDEYRAELGKQFCRRCEYCQPCPSGVMITPAMGYPVIAHRMSPKVSVPWSQKAMESTLQCTECGLCVTRCPYELPIPELLKKNYSLYETHRSSL
ncbi:MAG: aldo/keto reductase [Negativicutes bacterium]|nr:aldo/keto reductase [Negativicutes bacterium]